MQLLNLILSAFFLTLGASAAPQDAGRETEHPKVEKLQPIYKTFSKKSPYTLLIVTCATCSHCAQYYKQDLEEILRTFFIPSVKEPFSIQIMGFPTNKLSLKVEQVKWAKGPEFYLSFSMFLYDTQAKWMPSTPEITAHLMEQDDLKKKELFEKMTQESLDKIKDLLLNEFKDLKEKDIEAAWANATLEEQILQNRQELMDHFNFKGVPSFVWIKDAFHDQTFPKLITSEGDSFTTRVMNGLRGYFNHIPVNDRDRYSVELPMGSVEELAQLLSEDQQKN